MGVPWEECETVGTLVGLKTIVNEFVAYKKLGQFKDDGKLTIRAEAIATYAICGFSNPASLGIMIGSLSAMAPEKRKDIVASVLRAVIGGCAVCFLTASIAGKINQSVVNVCGICDRCLGGITTSDFRPIAILRFPFKVLEKLAHFQLTELLEHNGLVGPLQTGFRPLHSKHTALL